MANPYAVKLGIKIDPDGYLSTMGLRIENDEPDYVLRLLNDWEDVGFLTLGDIVEFDGATIGSYEGEDHVVKESDSSWTVWFALPSGLSVDQIAGRVSGPSSIFEQDPSFSICVEWSDSSVTTHGPQFVSDGMWDGYFLLGTMSIDPFETGEEQAELWQRKINTIEVNT